MLLSFRHLIFLWGLGLIPLLMTPLQAQEELAPQLGQIDPSWIETTQIEGLEDASACILQDYGSVEFDIIGNLPRLRYTYHRRIKILDEQGLRSFSRVEIPYNDSRGGRETFISAEGGTLGLNGEGESILFEINPRRIQNVRDEKNGGRKIIIEFPLLKVGSVIEYRYVFTSRDFQELRPWFFQDSLPILYSSYHAYIPNAFEYVITANGDIRALSQASTPYRPRAMNQPQQIRRMQNGTVTVDVGAPQNYGYYFTGTHHIYAMQDMPPIVEEEFSPETRDYVPSLFFQLERNHFNNSSNPNLFDNWTLLNRKMQRRLKVKRSPLDKKATRQTIQLARDKATNDLQVANNLYEMVRSNFTWDDAYQLQVGNLKQVFDRQLGNGTEINVVLLHLLRAAGFKAEPVLISTRDNGKVSARLPVSDQFNHLIVHVEINRTQYLLDALHDRPDFGVLPRQDLNQLGYRMSSGEGDWIRLSNPENTLSRTTYTRFVMAPDGNMIGEISVINKGYRAALERERLNELPDRSRDYFQQYVLAGLGDYKLDNPSFEDPADPEKPLILACDLVTPEFTERAGDLMIVKPILAWPIIENPFPQTERLTPIDLTFPLQESYMLGLIIPEGYEVQQLPEPIKVVMPNNAATFTFNVFQDDNILHITSVLSLNQTLFLPEEYQGVREFFAYVTRKHEEGIVLKRQVQ